MKNQIINIISYILILIIALLFALYIDGPSGSYMIITLILAAVISISYTVWLKKTLDVRLTAGQTVFTRGDDVTVILEVSQKGILPTPMLTANFYGGKLLSAKSDTEVRFSVFKSVTVKADFESVLFGIGKIGVLNIVITDFLGLISLSVTKNKAVTQEIKILPKKLELSSKCELVKALNDAVAYDESDETTDLASFINGFPGYEHRDYEPGDPLKKINWKLSAKRSQLYVRKDESAVLSEILFILDPIGFMSYSDNQLKAERIAAEGMLALIDTVIASQRSCMVLCMLKNSWNVFRISTPEDLNVFQYALSSYEYLEKLKAERLPLQQIKTLKISAGAIFTPAWDSTLQTEADNMFLSGFNMQIVSADKNLKGTNIWGVYEDADYAVIEPLF